MVPLLLTLDGDLADWTEPPRWMITAQSQVAGPERVANDQDLSARLWARLDAAGLWVAGDVRDDVVRLPAYATDIAADHPEIWLALPAPAMPPIGWANQFGEQTLTSAADCGQADLGSEPSECESWFAGQGPWRANLARMFVRQYVLTPQVTELYASSGDPKVPALPCCRASEAVVVPIDGGYRFEAHIGLADLPATLGDRITEARILVDIVDVDGPPRDPPVQESFLSITRKRRFADSSTFEVLRPVEPIRLPAPPFAARLLAPEARLARFPGQPDLGWTFENVPMGYQYEPSEPSPSPVVFDLKPRLLGRHAGFDLALAPIGGELSSVQELWVLRAGAVVAHAPLDVSHLERAGLVDGHPRLVFRDETTLSPLGAGACGACLVEQVRVVDVLADGSVRVAEASHMEEEYGGREPSITWRRFTIAPDLRSFQWEGETDTKPPRPVSHGWSEASPGGAWQERGP